ncbi:MAG: hypothetical protein ABIH49_00735 [archaeon]
MFFRSLLNRDGNRGNDSLEQGNSRYPLGELRRHVERRIEIVYVDSFIESEKRKREIRRELNTLVFPPFKDGFYLGSMNGGIPTFGLVYFNRKYPDESRQYVLSIEDENGKEIYRNHISQERVRQFNHSLVRNSHLHLN